MHKVTVILTDAAYEKIIKNNIKLQEKCMDSNITFTDAINDLVENQTK